MRVLLVSTYELGHQPLHVASPAGRLRDLGYDVQTVDVAVEQFDETWLEDVDSVAISVPMHTAMRIAQELVAIIAQSRPDLPVAVYGLYAGMGKIAGVSRVIVGEYEGALVDWLASLARGEDGAGTSIDIGRQQFAVPMRSGLPELASYAHLSVGDAHRTVGYTEASHGCRHRCRHCPLPVVYDGRYRIVPPQTVLADVETLVENGAEHVTFGDPDFFNGVPHAMKILEAANERFPDITFDLTIKVEHLLDNRHRLDELVGRNVLFVTSAFESTNDRVLELLDKGHTRQDMATVLELSKAAGLDIHPSWLPFTPWTERGDLSQIFEFIDAFDLFEVTEPIQLAIRLLIPRGSLVLDIPGIGSRLGEYDDSMLSYRWVSEDPGVDALQAAMAERAEQAAAADAPLVQTLTEMWVMALEVAGGARSTAQIPAGAITGRPRLTEPWFC